MKKNFSLKSLLAGVVVTAGLLSGYKHVDRWLNPPTFNEISVSNLKINGKRVDLSSYTYYTELHVYDQGYLDLNHQSGWYHSYCDYDSDGILDYEQGEFVDPVSKLRTGYKKDFKKQTVCFQIFHDDNNNGILDYREEELADPISGFRTGHEKYFRKQNISREEFNQSQAKYEEYLQKAMAELNPKL